MFHAKGIEVEEIDLTYKPAERSALAERTGKRTVPQIFVGDVYIGGYRELRALDVAGKLDELLAA